MPSPLHHQSHAAILRHIEKLRREAGIKTGGKRRRSVRGIQPFPDLSCASGASPLSNNPAVQFSSERKSAAHHPDAEQFPVGNQHKQGPELITPGMTKHLQFMSGKKT